VHTKQIGKNLFLVDLETGGFEHLICSYIITGEKPFLIESGPTSSVPRLLSGLRELNIKFEDVQYVAVTHVHLDHGGGAGTLLKSLPNAKVIVHPRGLQHLADPTRLWSSSQTVLGFISETFGKPEAVPREKLLPMTEGSFNLGYSGKLIVTETVGHASHNLSFYESFNGGIFPGDAAGTYLPAFDVIVPTTPPPFCLEEALQSVDKLINLNPSVLYLSHFGKVDNAIKRLKGYKTQLELWAGIAEDGVEKNQSLEQIRDRIVKEDYVMKQILSYVQNHRIYSKTILENCVLGFIEYAKHIKSRK
jgi:glyoxylase-like metal-dependent hydrolase (beta-lactamase superfamily II)